MMAPETWICSSFGCQLRAGKNQCDINEITNQREKTLFCVIPWLEVVVVKKVPFGYTRILIKHIGVVK